MTGAREERTRNTDAKHIYLSVHLPITYLLSIYLIIYLVYPSIFTYIKLAVEIY